MPGLNDPDGKDSHIIRDCCKFLLTQLPCAALHQIVLVVDGTNPRLSKPLKEIIRVLRDVFDADGGAGFVEHMSVMFTKMPYPDWSDEEPADFDSFVAEKKRELSDSWRLGLAKKEILDLSKEKADALQRRFVFVNNGLSPKKLKKLRNDFGVELDFGLNDIYLRAVRADYEPCV